MRKLIIIALSVIALTALAFYLASCGSSGLNHDAGDHADRPQLTVFDSHLYAVWDEDNGTAYQVRAAVYNSGSSWSFVDGNGVNGLNKNTAMYALSPQLTSFNSKAYAVWHEENGTAHQIRVKVYK